MRGKLGIEWDDLPSMAIDTDKIGTPMFMYPKGLPFKKNHVVSWLWSSFKDKEDEEYVHAAEQINHDKTIEKYFLNKLKPATR